ncbi:thymidylate synthase [Candidatus Phytoplasma melaleucae]|uniref:Thymidylate synthase n=1 Tax=Candidatus Phytoplasma melaleucae TaxID=2982630 RepID=A0ABT9DE12_9MOLU|nr:thymidylate synthase ['Melaleuca sp.' phytoplasma]MDO8167917.1 thymidylate synthase ['Melaleuca sp.' phytoplasma]MDV3205175.1 thymidylate synthase [Weeping tea tree witches'-broom phytoplasma]
MKQYLDLCRHIITNGTIRDNRTKIPTKSVFGYQMRFNLTQTFPLLTTKKINFKAIIHELLWFIRGDTNISYLVKNNVNIWNEWPYQKYCQSNNFQGENLTEFINKIKRDSSFAAEYGNLGPIYGKQWRNFSGVDQLQKVIQEIKDNPCSRRLIISAWNPLEIKDMLLPPCHILMQFYVCQRRLSLQLFQRSADVFLGIPFNISCYGLLLMMIAQTTNLKAYELIHSLGDAHIYINHLAQVKQQVQRIPKKLPKVTLNSEIKNIEDFKAGDIYLNDYKFHPLIRGKIAV